MMQATFLCGFGHVTLYQTIQKTTKLLYIYCCRHRHFKKCGHITKTECCNICIDRSCLNCGGTGLKIEKNKLTKGWKTIFLF